MNKLNNDMIVTPLVIKFVNLLRAFRPQMDLLDAECNVDSLVPDWMQANWEMIVEGPLLKNGIYLEVYGDGAEANGGSSRILYPQAMATHRICCTATNPVCDLLNNTYINIAKDPLPVEKFVEIIDEWYYEKSLFDKVLVLDGLERVFDIKHIDFILKPIN